MVNEALPSNKNMLQDYYILSDKSISLIIDKKVLKLEFSGELLQFLKKIHTKIPELKNAQISFVYNISGFEKGDTTQLYEGFCRRGISSISQQVSQDCYFAYPSTNQLLIGLKIEYNSPDIHVFQELINTVVPFPNENLLILDMDLDKGALSLNSQIFLNNLTGYLINEDKLGEVKFLLAEGADPNGFDYSGNKLAYSPVHRNNVELLREFEKYGADFSTLNPQKESILDEAISEYGYFSHEKDSEIKQKQCYEILNLLINWPGRIVIQDYYLEDIIKFDLLDVFTYYLKSKNDSLDLINSFRFYNNVTIAGKAEEYKAKKISGYLQSEAQK